MGTRFVPLGTINGVPLSLQLDLKMMSESFQEEFLGSGGGDSVVGYSLNQSKH